MKKLSLLSIILTLIVSTSLFSQTEKGYMYIGGNINISSLSNETINVSKSTSFNINVDPSIGVFVKDKLAVYGMLPIGYSTTNSEQIGVASSITKTLTNSYGVGVGINKYFPIYDKLHFNIISNIKYMYSKGESTLAGNTVGSSTGHNIGVNLSPGLSYFLSNKFQVQGTLGSFNVSYFNTSGSNALNVKETISKSINAGTNFGSNSWTLGFNYFFK